MATLQITDLHVSVETEDGPKEILKGVTLTINSGETHAIMGPNGSGKSTLAYSIAGHPKYTVTSGEVTLDGEDVLSMSVDERARAGLFLAMQYPVEVPGVTVSNFLRTAKTAIDGEAPKLRTWVKEVRGTMDELRMDPRSPSATSTRASRAARRSATRSSRWSCSSRSSPSSTRPTPVSTSTPCASSPRASIGPRHDRRRRPAHHALHADPALHHPRVRPRLRRRTDRRAGRPRAGRPARGRGYDRFLATGEPATTAGA